MKNHIHLLVGLALVNLSLVATSAFADEREFVLPPSKPLAPATRYSGRTPIDLSNGIPFNNGTYGLPNPNYEKWAETPVVFPGVSELNYPYNDKEGFVTGLRESQYFVEDAIANWKTTSEITKPEAKAYGEASANTMQPLLDRYKDAIKQADGAGKNDWDKAQADARRALVELRSTYTSLHKNVR